MQTLTSSLVLHKAPNDVYSRCLFNGIGYVPIIEQLQRYLDYAHAQGFDPEGLKELGQTEGKRVWIGAVDVAAVLRSFYVPAAIFDFQLSSASNSSSNTNTNTNSNHNHNSNGNGQSNQEEKYHHDLFDWVWDYFRQRYEYHGVDENHAGNRGQRPISSYFQAASAQSNNGGDSGAFSDDDSMLQHALEMSKKETNVGGSSGNGRTENGKKKRKSSKRKDGSSKMEMDEDSDSGSSFSDEVEIHGQDGNEQQEEKKSDENEDDLFFMDDEETDKKKANQFASPTQKTIASKFDDEWSGDHCSNHTKKTNDEEPTKTKQAGDGTTKRKERFIPPLYFQHQGHSRTIIGIVHNKRSGLKHLLVLDPSVKKGAINLLNTIKNGNVSVLYRSLKQTTSAKYQIVAIPTYGIMTNGDRNRCKTMQSMDVTLMNKLHASK